MTKTLHYEEFETNGGVRVYIEEYQDKGRAPFWRYGPVGGVWSDMLLTKPRKKRIIERY